MNKKYLYAILVLSSLLPGCGFFLSGRPYTQAQIKNFETRNVDAPFDAVYAAATEALFDLGYVIKHSERASGLVMGEKTGTERVWISASQGKPGEYIDKQRTYNLTFLIKKEGTKTTNVRIKTSVDGEPKLNKSMVDQAWVYVDRQVMMEAEVPQVKKADYAKKGGKK